MTSVEPNPVTLPTPVPAPGPATAAPLGRTVTKGVSVGMALSVGAKLLGFAAQIVLAWLLSPGDFGVYVAALATANLVLIFRDGGVREMLVQRGVKEYRALEGPVFWLALSVNVLVALLLALIAPFAASFSNMPQMAGVLWVTAASLPLATPGAIMMCRLRIDLRFVELSRIQTVSAVLRYVTMVAMAALGMGPLSFTIPLVVIALYENFACYRATHDAPWAGKARLDMWPGFLGRSGWLFLGALASMLVDQGDYFVAMRFIPSDLLGYYGFANQMLLQSAYALLAVAASQVLFPALARLADEPRRHADASMRILRALMLVASPACLGLAVLFAPLERWLLGGKWDQSIVPMLVLGAMYPIRCTLGFTAAFLQSQGRFKRWAIWTIGEGLLLIGVCAFTSTTFGTPTALALGTALCLIATRTIVIAAVLRRAGTPVRVTLSAVYQPWIVAAGAAAVVYNTDRAFLAGVPDWARFLLGGMLYALVFGFGARLLLARQLRDAIATLPVRLAPLALRALMLRAHNRPGAGSDARPGGGAGR